ncbi:uncharacterized protein LOC127508678 [Ctenopharyngodon idella]|uniref:uncharacterized protein LOC127508678 n=1 Tax=Ctenopharyngodon idella TaxID=7959 RepID=UPI00222F484C|nr:uncharacterized protein LOC127508678 [Ctenopharyngodon idella]
MGCTHGVVYYASPLWWQESARDHGDALLSFKHPPTVYICDIAGRVARHVNNRTHQQFFQPHDGRVCEPTEANISLASAGKLRVNLDWVANIKKKTRLNLEHSTTEQFSQPHPETGTSDRFSFYDRFHQKKQKRPEEKLRSLKAIPELASLINTAEAEQVNRELSSSRYSLCQMKDTHYMFSLRLYFHLHNARKNSAFLKEMQKRTDENIHLGLHGKLACGQKETITQQTEQQGRDPHVPAKVDSVPEEGKKFSVAMFPIEQRHKETISKLYSVKRNDNEVIARISSYAILYLRDLKSVLPPHLLSDTSGIAMPWLSDNVSTKCYKAL